MTWTKAHAEAFDKARWEVYRVIVSDPCYRWVVRVDEVVSPTGGKFHYHATYATRDEAITAAKALFNGVKISEHSDDSGVVWATSDAHIPYGNFTIRGWHVDKEVACE